MRLGKITPKKRRAGIGMAVLASIGGMPAIAGAQTSIWTDAGGDSDWNTPANWLPNGVPDSNSSAIVGSPSPTNLSTTAAVDSLTIGSLGVLNVQTSATLSVANSAANIGGQINIDDGTLDLGTTATLQPFNTNNAGGQITVSGTATNLNVNSGESIDGGTISLNSGTVTLSSSTSLSNVTINGSGEVTSRISPALKYFELNNLTVATGSQITLLGGQPGVGVYGTLTNNGTVNLNYGLFFYGATMEGTGTLAMNPTGHAGLGGSFTQLAGNSIVGAGGIFSASGPFDQMGGQINFNGLVDANSADETLFVRGIVNNAGVMEATDDGTLEIMSNPNAGPTTVTNTGIIEAGANSQVQIFGTTSSSFSTTITNTGGQIIAEQNATLMIRNTTIIGGILASVPPNFTGLVVSNSTLNDVTLATGTELNIQGTLTVTGTLTFPSNSEVGPGPELRGIGTIAGPHLFVDNLSPGDPFGTLTLEGNFKQNLSPDLLISIGSEPAAMDFGVLSVDGTATLAGTLDVSFLNGFIPVAGDTYDFLVANAVVGQFSTIDTPYPLQLNYTSTGVTLTVLPEPSAVGLAGIGLALLSRRKRS